MLFYVIFDRYSLLQAETVLYINELKEELDSIDMVCSNISEVGDEGVHSLATCVNELIKISSSKKKKIHVFIDEYDSEDLTENDCKLLKSIIDEHFYSSYFIVVLQSIKKPRYFINSSGGYPLTISAHSLDILKESIKFLYLTKVMRFSKHIHSVAEEVKKHLSSKENRYLKPQDTSPTNVSHDQDTRNNYTGGEIQAETQKTSRSILQQHGDDSEPSTSEQPSSENINSLFDRQMKQSGAESTVKEDASDPFIRTKFEFFKTNGCGHGIEGFPLSLIRIPRDSSNDLIASAIKKIAKPKWKKCLFICIDLEIANIVLRVASSFRLNLTVHVAGLTETSTSSDDMMNLYKQWVENSNSVLLTDNQGCRGLENENVSFLYFFPYNMLWANNFNVKINLRSFISTSYLNSIFISI